MCTTLHHEKDKPGKPDLPRKQNAIVAVLRDRPVMALMSVDLTGAAYAMGAAWLGHKMRTSRFGIVRKLWWLPQAYSIEQNVYGYAYTRAHYTR